MHPFRTLRGRLTLLAALTTLPAFLFVVFLAAKERSDALVRAEREARYVAEVASREHAHQVTGARRVLEQLSRADDVASLSPILPAIVAAFPQIANLWIVDARGALAYSVVPPPQHITLRENPVFVKALGSRDVAVGRYQVGPIVGRPVLLMAKALRGPDGAAHHVLVAALELSWLDQLARQAGLPAKSTLIIADAEGRALAGASGSIVPFAPVAAAPGRMQRVRVAGLDQLAVAIPLSGAPELRAVVATPAREVYAIANRIFIRDTAVLALLAMFAVGMSLLSTDLSVLRDLRLLAAATRRFGAGDLTVRAPVPQPRGEIRELTVDFNTMADALEQRQEHLRALSERLTAAREEEATRIARELHDQIGQELTVLKLDLENVRRKAGASGDLADAIDEMSARIDAAVETVRRLSSELRPGVLDRLGLVAALEWLLRDFRQRTGVDTDLVMHGTIEPLPEEVSTALFRIAQEAVTNVARHADATLVEIVLRREGDRLELAIHDDGRGFHPDSLRGHVSLGLLGMEERARRIGGSMKIESAPAEGTRVHVSVSCSTAQ